MEWMQLTNREKLAFSEIGNSRESNTSLVSQMLLYRVGQKSLPTEINP